MLIENVIVKKGTPCKFEFGVINLSPRVAHKLKVSYTIDNVEEKVVEFKTVMGANVGENIHYKTIPDLIKMVLIL